MTAYFKIPKCVPDGVTDGVVCEDGLQPRVRHQLDAALHGEDIPHVPNKRTGGVCIGGKIAPIFYNTMEDSGALPIELDVT